MKIKVKPKEGVKVVMPGLNRDLPQEGAEVESSTYWHRRLAEGDVVLIGEVKEEKQQPLESAKQPAKSK